MNSPQSELCHVCHLSSVHFATDTRIFYKYARSLSSEYRVTVVGLHPNKEVIEGIHIIPFTEFKYRGTRLFLSWFLMLIKALRIKANVYHIHDPELLMCAFFLQKMGKKVIIDVHENIAEDIFEKDWLPFKKGVFAIFNVIERAVCKNNPVVVSEDSYLERYRQFAPNLRVIHNYVETQHFAPFRSSERDPLKLFYMGIILESRCILEILDAMYMLHQKGLRVSFHCVGKLYKRIQTQIESHPNYPILKPYLFFYDRMLLTEGYKHSVSCGIGLCLIKPMRNAIESKPTKLFEYMACGLPIVTSHFPLYQSLVDNWGLGVGVDPNYPAQIADAIQGLIENPLKRAAISDLGPKVAVTHFDWSSERIKLMALYNEVLREDF